MKMHISKQMKYDEIETLVEKLSKKYDEVYFEVKPMQNGWSAHLIIKTPDIQFDEAVRDCL
jgi:hypothetical protein